MAKVSGVGRGEVGRMVGGRVDAGGVDLAHQEQAQQEEDARWLAGLTHRHQGSTRAILPPTTFTQVKINYCNICVMGTKSYTKGFHLFLLSRQCIGHLLLNGALLFSFCP